MTAKELIEALQQLDPETRIFTVGYEGGLNDAELPERVHDIALDVYDQWYYGKHEYLDHRRMEDKSKHAIVKGIVL
jgi:hypothetical protein